MTGLRTRTFANSDRDFDVDGGSTSSCRFHVTNLPGFPIAPVPRPSQADRRSSQELRAVFQQGALLHRGILELEGVNRARQMVVSVSDGARRFIPLFVRTRRFGENVRSAGQCRFRITRCQFYITQLRPVTYPSDCARNRRFRFGRFPFACPCGASSKHSGIHLRSLHRLEQPLRLGGRDPRTPPIRPAGICSAGPVPNGGTQRACANEGWDPR